MKLSGTAKSGDPASLRFLYLVTNPIPYSRGASRSRAGYPLPRLGVLDLAGEFDPKEFFRVCPEVLHQFMHLTSGSAEIVIKLRVDQ